MLLRPVKSSASRLFTWEYTTTFDENPSAAELEKAFRQEFPQTVERLGGFLTQVKAVPMISFNSAEGRKTRYLVMLPAAGISPNTDVQPNIRTLPNNCNLPRQIWLFSLADRLMKTAAGDNSGNGLFYAVAEGTLYIFVFLEGRLCHWSEEVGYGGVDDGMAVACGINGSGRVDDGKGNVCANEKDDSAYGKNLDGGTRKKDGDAHEKDATDHTRDAADINRHSDFADGTVQIRLDRFRRFLRQDPLFSRGENFPEFCLETPFSEGDFLRATRDIFWKRFLRQKSCLFQGENASNFKKKRKIPLLLLSTLVFFVIWNVPTIVGINNPANMEIALAEEASNAQIPPAEAAVESNCAMQLLPMEFEKDLMRDEDAARNKDVAQNGVSSLIRDSAQNNAMARGTAVIQVKSVAHENAALGAIAKVAAGPPDETSLVDSTPLRPACDLPTFKLKGVVAGKLFMAEGLATSTFVVGDSVGSWRVADVNRDHVRLVCGDSVAKKDVE